MKKKIIVALFSLIALLIINPYKSITASAKKSEISGLAGEVRRDNRTTK